MSDQQTLSHLIDKLAETAAKQDIAFRDILSAFSGRSFGALLFIIALPAALPIPAVGYGTILALPLLFITAQQAIGHSNIWVPQNIQSKSISSTKLSGMIAKARPWVARLERLMTHRLGFMTGGLIMPRLIGIAGFIMALSVLIPLPMTNTVPSLGICLMAAGVLMRDGLAVVAGLLIGLAWISILTYFIITFGHEGVDMMKDLIKSIG